MFRSLASTIVLASAFLSFFFFGAVPAFAQSDVESGYSSIMESGLIFANICPGGPGSECQCRDTGQCSVDDVMQIFVNISTGILGIIGSVVLLMFVYGGFVWITSEGDPGRVNQGKQTVVNAVIGLALVLGAYAIMTFAIAAVTGVQQGQDLEGTVEDVIQQGESGQ